MFYSDLNTPLLWTFTTFITKTNPICANNNPNLQTFKKSEVASKQKIASTAVKRFLLEFGRVSRSASAVLQPQHCVSFHNEQTCKKNTAPWKIIVSGRSKRFSESYRAYKSNLNRRKVW